MTDLISDPTAAVPEPPPVDADLEPDEGKNRKRVPIGAWLSGAWLTLVVFLALFADFLPLEDPSAEIARPKLAPGQDGLILGADGDGRDMLSRLIHGGRNSLAIAVFSLLIGFVVGGLLGLGYEFWLNQSAALAVNLNYDLRAVPGDGLRHTPYLGVRFAWY